MYYPDELVEEIRSKNDIVDIISGYVKMQKRGADFQGLCPFHNEKSPSFHVSPSKQLYHCFGCGAGGNVFTFLMNYENYTFQEAIEVMAKRAGVNLPEIEYSEEVRKEADQKSLILEINKEAARYFYYQLRMKQGKIGYDYLINRGLCEDTIKKFGLGYSNKTSNDLVLYLKSKGYTEEQIVKAGLASASEKYGLQDKFWNRVIFPILDINHRAIGFGGRVMGEGNPKYLNSPETIVFDKGRNLYGLNLARTSRKNNIILCEGYMDVISLHQAGFTNAAACLGTAMTQGQANLLKRYTNQVILTYDSDGAGTKAALRAIPILKSVGMTVKVLNLKPYKDPDEFIKNLGADAFRQRIAEAMGSFLFEIAQIHAQYDMKDPESKTKFQRAVAAKLCGFSSELERNNYMEAICEQYRISFDGMRQMVAEEARRTGLTARPQEERAPQDKKKKDKEDGIRTSQKLLLTWLIEAPQLYGKIAKILSPADFTEDLYRRVADMVWQQLQTGLVNPGGIVNHFINDAEEYKEVAALFNTKLRSGMTKEEQEKAFEETVLRVKRNSLDEASRRATDVMALQEIIRQQAALRDLHISFD